jgi:outer membrane protein OmpA-like peptidoglycan-associated protein
MKTIAVFGLLAMVAGCAPAIPPQDLLTARASYDRASHGPAAQVDPADLLSAKEALDSAERSFSNNGDTQDTRDAAYTADRRAQVAEVRAQTAINDQQRATAIAQMHANESNAVRTTSAALQRANQQLASTDQQLQTERQRRQDAEKRAAQASADLARIASVKQEARGMVITLSGSVLFASAKSDLLPDAQVKLNDVAKALAEQDPDAKMVVGGYTDSQGSASFNQDLSQRRADSVRSYLVSHGIASDRITAQGFGPSQPVSDNASVEGRANNRRVEIVVQPTSATATK